MSWAKMAFFPPFYLMISFYSASTLFEIIKDKILAISEEDFFPSEKHFIFLMRFDSVGLARALCLVSSSMWDEKSTCCLASRLRPFLEKFLKKKKSREILEKFEKCAHSMCAHSIGLRGLKYYEKS
jgi:hypothetical protein